MLDKGKEGQCPGCHDKESKLLQYKCPCLKEWYCSERCLEKCLLTHIKTCPVGGIEEDELSPIYDNENKKTPTSMRGLTGLTNLGNTCFMNTSLQCLSNCWELTNYFLTNKYKKDINYKNPIGTQGRLCRIYSNLLRNLWYGTKTEYRPKNFKMILDTITRNFKGNEQQDAEEFLSYMIDLLHEDLNRVIEKKPLSKDNNSNQEIIQSLKEWYSFKQLNQSIFIDFFYGQFKSLIYCPNIDCQYVSRNYEPFFCIPLPVETKTKVFNADCFFIFYDIAIKPIKLSFIFDKDYTLLELRYKIAKLLHIHPFSFIIGKMNTKGLLNNLCLNDQLVSTSSNLKSKDNRRPYFLFQIDPSLFYNPKCNEYITKENIQNYYTNKYEVIINELEIEIDNAKKFTYGAPKTEEKKEIPIQKKCISYYLSKDSQNGFDNYGFNDNYINILIFISKYSGRTVSKKEEIIFPRIITLNKEDSCKDIHKKVFYYFKALFLNLKFEEAFDSLNTDNENDTFEYHSKCKYPYRLRIVNIMQSVNKECLICGKRNCSNCLLPYSDTIKLKDILEKYPKNSDGKTIDNTFFYLNDNQRKECKNWNKDFNLEITVFKEQHEPIFTKLNDYLRHEFNPTKKKYSGCITIEECLSNFLAVEELDLTNEYYCDKCKSQQKAKKQIVICKCPHILIIQLKRFIATKKSKIFVDFPINGLDMSKFVQYNPEGFPMEYDLFAVAYHSGESDYGHYYAICKNVVKDKWYKYEDSRVKEISREQIINEDAYLLFYRRRGLENIVDLESVYQSTFINYQKMVIDLENDYNEINKIVDHLI